MEAILKAHWALGIPFIFTVYNYRFTWVCLDFKSYSFALELSQKLYHYK